MNSQEKMILVVDDDKSMRTLLSLYLSKLGHTLAFAECGKDAFKVILNNKIDIMITDINMSDGDGIELIQNIRLLPPDIQPIICVATGLNDLDLNEKLDDSILEKIIFKKYTKPLDVKNIVGDVDNTLNIITKKAA